MRRIDDSDDEDLWHPSGWSPVYDRFLGADRLLGFTNLQVAAPQFRMSRPDPSSDMGVFFLTGSARRMLHDMYFCWVVEDGDARELPDFWPI